MDRHPLGDPVNARQLIDECVKPRINDMKLATALAEVDQIVAHWRSAGWSDLCIGAVIQQAIELRGFGLPVTLAILDREL